MDNFTMFENQVNQNNFNEQQRLFMEQAASAINDAEKSMSRIKCCCVNKSADDSDFWKEFEEAEAYIARIRKEVEEASKRTL